MWSGPRTVSTALMRAWENRPDTVVADEPLYAFYLDRTGIAHPGRDEVIASQPTGWQTVIRQLTTAPLPGGRTVFYGKHMTHHLLPEVDRDALAPLRHAFLIRDPRELLASYARVRATPTLDDLGIWQQAEIFDRFGGPVIDSRDLLEDPEAVLRGLCAALGVPFTAAMLSWPPGPRETDGVWAPHWYDSVWRFDRLRPVPPAGPGAPAAARRAGRPVPAVLPAAPGLPPDRRARPGSRTPPGRPGSCVPPGRPGSCTPLRSLLVLQTFDERNRDLVVNVGGVLSHRDQAAISPFDSAVQGGDAVWEGLRLYQGRIFRLDEHLARLRRSAAALAFTGVPSGRGDHRADPPHPARERDDRWRAHPAHPDPRGEDHQRHGSPAQPVRADPDRAGRAQGPRVRPVRDHADHLERAPPGAGRPGSRRSTTTTCSPRSWPRSRPTWPGRTTRSCWTAGVSWPRPTRRTCSW